MKRSITKNYLYNLVYQVLLILVPLITTPYLSNVLGAESIGIFSYTISIVTYFILFGSLGVAMYGQREIAYVQENKKERSKTFFGILIMRFITLSIAMITFYLCFALHGEYSIYYKILLLELIANAFDISWFFQGLEEFKKTVLRNVIVKILSVIAILVFVNSKEDLIIYFLIYTISTLLGNISLWLYLPRYIEKVSFKELDIKKHLKPTIALFIPQIAVQVYTVLDKTMIGYISKDMIEVGSYEQSQKIIKIAMILVTSLGTVVSPRIASAIATNQKNDVKKYLSNSFNFVWFLGIPIMFGIMGTAQDLVPWFLGEEFSKSVILLIVGSLLIMAIGLNNVSGIQYLIAAKKQNIFTNSVIIGAIFNFLANMILIPSWKSIGAIVASVLAEILIFLIQLIYIRKDFSLKIVFSKSFCKYIISGICMFFTTFGIGLIMPGKILTTIIQIVCGIFVYFILLLFFKDKILFETIDKVKNKFSGGK